MKATGFSWKLTWKIEIMSLLQLKYSLRVTGLLFDVECFSWNKVLFNSIYVTAKWRVDSVDENVGIRPWSMAYDRQPTFQGTKTGKDSYRRMKYSFIMSLWHPQGYACKCTCSPLHVHVMIVIPWRKHRKAFHSHVSPVCFSLLSVFVTASRKTSKKSFMTPDVHYRDYSLWNCLSLSFSYCLRAASSLGSAVSCRVEGWAIDAALGQCFIPNSFISPGCPRPNSALTVHKSDLKHRSSILTVYAYCS